MKQLYTMQKFLALCLIFSMTLAILAGCKKEEQNPAGTISDFESQTHFQVGTSGDDSASGDTSKAPPTGEFVVSEKRYSYEGVDLMVLYVENQTNRHYNITINGTYLDENGESLKEESQSFEGFAAGWQNFFIFRPEVMFDRFEYSLLTEEYIENPIHSDSGGVPYSSYIELCYEKNLQWIRGANPGEEHPVEMRDLVFHAELINHHSVNTVAVSFYLILLDDQGEIYYCSRGEKNYIVGEIGGTSAGPIGSDNDGLFDVVIKEQNVGEDETIPDNVQGVFTAIFAIIDVNDKDRFAEQVE